MLPFLLLQSSYLWNLFSTFAIACLISVFLLIACHRIVCFVQRRRRRRDSGMHIAFFHPYCTGGGGGERVLWKMIQVLGRLIDREGGDLLIHPTVTIYTIDDPSPVYTQDVMKHIHDRFGLQLSNKLRFHFVHLHRYRFFLKPVRFLSLLLESAGAMCLAYAGLFQSFWDSNAPCPDLCVDTTGCAFTYVPATILFGCRVLAYVHYPTISTDMLQLVWERRRSGTYNHQAYIAASAFTTYMKLFYYICFAMLYGCIGSLSTMVLVNSTWTYNHIHFLWKYAAWKKRIRIVFPPCSLPSSSKGGPSMIGGPENRQPIVLSIGQFRPEKDHILQIEAMARYIELTQSSSTQPEAPSPQLVLIGGCRNPEDERRLQNLKQLCSQLDVSQHVTFVVNEPFAVVQEWLGKASIGIHTMWNEHFGIGIVEMMAAGLIVVAHNSGGPKTDIVTPLSSNVSNSTTGFLASSVDEYADCIHRVLSMSVDETMVVRCNAVESAKRFTDEVFEESFEKAILDLKV